MPYTQSKQFFKNQSKNTGKSFGHSTNVQTGLLDFVLSKAAKNNPKAVQNAINQYCQQNWMMDVGEQKGQILKMVLKKKNPNSILELGGYCGYSALIMAYSSNATVHSIEPNQFYASIASKIHEHAGLSNKIIIHIGTLQTQNQFIKNHGAFDFLFFDHGGYHYLPDFLQLEKLGGIKKGSVLAGDNIIYPGAPDYLQHFKQSKDYNSVLYHSYLEYINYHDALLVSEKIV